MDYNNLQNISSNYYKKLLKYYGRPITPLKYENMEQLAIAVILSAQCTDKMVNKITPVLFSKYKNLFELARAPVKNIEKLIYSSGFYKTKAANIKKLANILIQKYNSKLPDNFEILISLPGIGRKTANVIMSSGFKKITGIVVDTHVKRLSNRLGFTSKQDPFQIEKDLMNIWPKYIWYELSLLLIFHGRKYCKSQNPNCDACFLNDTCFYKNNNQFI
ncbi:MAG: endonuclease III [Spirochaetia bacterium]|nr:endonuclease III [Spirochaetia bacterium]